MRTTHTLARLDVSPETCREIHDLLRAAGYDHAIDEREGHIDMTGIALAPHPRERNAATPHDEPADVRPTRGDP